jgi:hypothetical protein
MPLWNYIVVSTLETSLFFPVILVLLIAGAYTLAAYSQSTMKETRVNDSTIGEKIQGAEINRDVNDETTADSSISNSSNNINNIITGSGNNISNNNKSIGSASSGNVVNMGTYLHPLILPNPVRSSEQAVIIMNHTNYALPVSSIQVDILGPNIGSTNPDLSPMLAGSQSMSLISGSPQNGTWRGNLEFLKNMPDGDYLYLLTINSTSGKTASMGPFSSIVLDRHLTDIPQTKIISAFDTDSGIAISDGGSTNATNITFKFEGSDKSGVIHSLQCNLDDIIIASQHAEHDQDPAGNASSAFSTCYTPLVIGHQAIGYSSYSDIAPGTHHFEVRAVDNEYNHNNTGSEFAWTVLPKPQVSGNTTKDPLS